ncbi:MAG: hypothetical protein F6J94_13665 [Moorea sp. SIO1F2]|uniref:hypothetical protein n=1 Tax=unclassified Moorena TaxID=2683338 RepID=UPI0013BA408E|nr:MULTISPECIES: hypothetical protein [unclassified Moorena]NEN97000.1 hypothetical protein [Moorena sp. SIO3I7]NEO08664.1 hypothetical protein [Moorena sp. SIO3I8]NEO11582.1 hypothetical protein [Moorena sp. SIO3E8]NEO22943.1 hypothetical protein [Moorena sp. SIO4A5]NEP23020.1 hypothetical protein [Moorena sp. SIO3I6]
MTISMKTGRSSLCQKPVLTVGSGVFSGVGSGRLPGLGELLILIGLHLTTGVPREYGGIVILIYQGNTGSRGISYRCRIPSAFQEDLTIPNHDWEEGEEGEEMEEGAVSQWCECNSG